MSQDRNFQHLAEDISARKRKDAIIGNLVLAVVLFVLSSVGSFTGLLIYNHSPASAKGTALGERIDRNAQITRVNAQITRALVTKQTGQLRLLLHQTHRDLTVHARASAKRSCATAKIIAKIARRAIPNVSASTRLIKGACTFVPPP